MINWFLQIKMILLTDFQIQQPQWIAVPTTVTATGQSSMFSGFYLFTCLRNFTLLYSFVIPAERWTVYKEARRSDDIAVIVLRRCVSVEIFL